jgi:acetyl esterase/lipase
MERRGRLCLSGPVQEQIISLWPGVAPGSESWTHQEVEYRGERNQQMMGNVVTPTLTAFLPDPSKATDTAIIVAPGGGFRFLGWDSEGTEGAQWLRERGVAAFVLKYRLVNTGATEQEQTGNLGRYQVWLIARVRQAVETHPAGVESSDEILKDDPELQMIQPLAVADGRQAIRVIRQRASEWGISPERIGIMGFSAGAWVTMGVVLDHDEQSRPNFAASVYGGGPRGATVPEDAPPLFIVAASDDALTRRASVNLYLDWLTAGRSAELHLYAKGGHGFGMSKQGLPIDTWIERFGDWLESQDLLKKSS